MTIFNKIKHKLQSEVQSDVSGSGFTQQPFDMNNENTQDSIYTSDGEIKEERKVNLLKSLILKFKDYNSGLTVKGAGDSSGYIGVKNKHNSFLIYTFKSALQFWSSQAKKEFLKYFVETDKLEVNSGARIKGKIYDANTNKSLANANIETDKDGKLVLVEKSGATTPDSGWISLKEYLTNDWVEFGAGYEVEYRIIGKVVYIRGLVKHGTAKAIFKDLPKDIIPPKKLYFANAISNKNVHGNDNLALVIGSHGVIESRKYSKEWTSVACSYILD